MAACVSPFQPSLGINIFAGNFYFKISQNQKLRSPITTTSDETLSSLPYYCRSFDHSGRSGHRALEIFKAGAGGACVATVCAINSTGVALSNGASSADAHTAARSTPARQSARARWLER